MDTKAVQSQTSSPNISAEDSSAVEHQKDNSSTPSINGVTSIRSTVTTLTTQHGEKLESQARPKLLRKGVSIDENKRDNGFGGIFDEPNFDEIFANPGHYTPKLSEIVKFKDSTDEATSSSLDTESPEDNAIFKYPKPNSGPGSLQRNESAVSFSKISRVDSIMEQTFMQMLAKSSENSQGFTGFRRRIANDINHKYCSFFRCDDILFIFLHVVFGMVYICAGVFGVMECHSLEIINYFMLMEGVLSVFLYPILIMNWAKRIGGCVHEDQKVGPGFCFLAVLIVRITTAVTGTVLLLLNFDQLTSDNMWCQIVINIFLTSVILSWTFLFCAILLPLCIFGMLYVIAKNIS